MSCLPLHLNRTTKDHIHLYFDIPFKRHNLEKGCSLMKQFLTTSPHRHEFITKALVLHYNLQNH